MIRILNEFYRLTQREIQYYYMIKEFLEETVYRKSILSTTIPLSALLGLALGLGSYLERDGKVDFSNPGVYLSCILTALLALAGLILVWLGLDTYAGRTGIKRETFPCKKTHWLILYLLLAASYSITFLAVFPGFFAYDATMAHLQVYRGELLSQHPWIHTLLLGYICEFSKSHLGHANVGIAIYIFVQMLLVSGCFLYTLYSIKRRGHTLVFILSFFFYAFFPTIHMFALCSTKDTPFSAAMLVLLVLLWDMFEDTDGFFASRLKSAAFIFFTLVFLILRKNAIYAMVVFLPFFLAALKRNRRKGALLIGAAFLLFWLYDVPLTAAMNVIDIGPKEALSVPSQQLARVYMENKDSLTEDETALLESFYPKEFLEMYLPKLADYTKGTLNTEFFLTHKKEFIRLWASAGIRNPDIYINSFLVNTYGFWYPWASLDGYKGYAGMKDTPLENAEVYYFAYVTEEPGERISLIPWLDQFYFRLSTWNLHQRLPGLSLLFSPGFLFWVFMTAWAYSIHRKNRAYYPAFILIGLMWLTVQLGPIALVRYVLYLYFGLPLLMSALLKKESLPISKK